MGIDQNSGRVHGDNNASALGGCRCVTGTLWYALEVEGNRPVRILGSADLSVCFRPYALLSPGTTVKFLKGQRMLGAGAVGGPQATPAQPHVLIAALDMGSLRGCHC